LICINISDYADLLLTAEDRKKLFCSAKKCFSLFFKFSGNYYVKLMFKINKCKPGQLKKLV